MGSSFSTSTIFRGVDRMSPVFDRMSRKTTLFGSVLKGVLGANIIQSGFMKLKAGMSSFIVEASKMEDVTAAFTPLMGGVSKATELVDALNKTAATTPFQFENISSAAKQLLPVMNQDINNTIDTFRMLGDTAGGNAQKLDSITRGFTKSMLKGKVDMESLNMIAEAGVPIYTELSKSMGVSVKEMMNMSSAGTIASDDLVNAFKAMTSDGGIFFNGMDIASKTLSGRLSTLSDNIKLTAASLGSNLLPLIKPVVDIMITAAGTVREWASANKDLINIKIVEFIDNIKTAALTVFKFGKVLWKLRVPIIMITSAILGYKAALIGLVVAQKVMIAVMAIQKLAAVLVMFNTIRTSMGLWTAAQWLLNAAMTANPIGLIVAGVAALAAGAFLVIKNWDTIGAFFANIWEGIKTGLMVAVEFMKGVFFTFADVILTTYGNIFKGIMGTAAKIGDFFGLDVSGIDSAIGKLESIQASIREKSFINREDQSTQSENNSSGASFNQTINATSGVDIDSSTSVNGAPAINKSHLMASGL